MRNVFRMGMGISGLLSLMTMANLWLNTKAAAAMIGLAPDNMTGLATVRADIAGLFGGIGLLAIFAAWKEDSAIAGWALLLVSCALTGRIVSLAIDGAEAASWPPIIVECFTIAIMIGARRMWRNQTT